MEKLFRRISAVLLAGAMLMQTSPALPSLAIKAEAAAGPNGYDVDLSFRSDYVAAGENPTQAIIVLGNQIVINEKKWLSTATTGSPPLTPRAQTGLTSEFNKDPGKYVDITAAGVGTDKTLMPKADFRNAMINGTGKATLAIEGNYTAVLTQGQGTLSGNRSVDVIAQPSFSVSDESKIKIKVKKKETVKPEQFLEFEIEGTPTGQFAGVEEVIVSNGYTRPEAGITTASGVPNRTIAVQFRGDNYSGNGRQESFQFVVNDATAYYGEDPDNPSPSTPGEQPKYHNALPEGWELTISFQPPNSSPLLLDVYTPEFAVGELGKDVRNGTSIVDPSLEYVKLDPDDARTFITTEFQLMQHVERYNEKGNDRAFRIEWFWQPDNAGDQDCLDGIKAYPGEGVKSSSHALTPMGYKEVRVTRRVDNVYGKLIARIKYLQNQDVAEYFDDFELPITIAGTGDPSRTFQYGQKVTVGASSTELTLFPNESVVPPSVAMDVYDGRYAPDFPKTEDQNPYKYVLRLNMGNGNGRADYAILECIKGSADIVEITHAQNDSLMGEPIEMSGGKAQIDNPSELEASEGREFLHFTAAKTGSATFQITYYIKNAKQELIPTKEGQVQFTINVEDTSPEDNGLLDDVILRDDKNEKRDFGFTPEQLEYEIDIENAVKYVTFKPTVQGRRAKREIECYLIDLSGRETYLETVISGRTGKRIELPDNSTITVKMVVTAENKETTTYLFEIRHLPPSEDSWLEKLELREDTDTDNLLTDFRPGEDGPFDYTITVPFGIDMLHVTYEPAAYATVTTTPSLVRKSLFGKQEWLQLNDDGMPTRLLLTVEPEDKQLDHYSYYTVTINRQPPSSDATLAELHVWDEDTELQYTPALHNDMTVNDAYIVDTIPYTLDKVRVSAVPTDANATMEIVYTSGSRSMRQTISSGVKSRAVTIPFVERDGDYYEITLEVTAENGTTVKAYPVRVVRRPPSDDATLASMTIADQDGGNVQYDPVFAPDTSSYSAEVPYEVEKVAITVTPSYEGANVRINGRNVAAGQASSLIKLTESKTTSIPIEVTAENGKTVQKYTVRIKRNPPSSDARLKSLTTTGTENWQPIFLPDTLNYSAEIVAGQPGVTITATPNHPYATVKIDGKRVENAKPSELIEMMKLKQKVEIEVTAQDGKTKRTYTIVFTDRNKIELTDNANLASLKVTPGEMSPKFQASVTSYDVAVKEDVGSVQIIPKAEDEYAKVQVFAGSVEIGDWENNYAQYIVDGSNEFTVRVTSASGKVTKEYQILVYRNDEDNMGTLTPLTPEDINWEQTGDVVQVDITKYPRISAGVFNTIKEEYPEKTIVFQGNDYSLEFRGEDLDVIVPQTEVFDFTLSFTSPEKNDIMNILTQYPGNDEARIVYLYFDHHGALPGPATFSISLGMKYENDTLFWHYYNPERDRIDYYGSVNTNSRGTFAVRIDHLSTYLVADQRLVGSENKTDATLTSNAGQTANGGDLSAITSAIKPNPSTGTGKGA